MTAQLIRRVVIATFVGGIVGMIVGSIADNNGVALTFGIITAVAALGLILVTSVTQAPATEEGVDDAMAEALETRISALVDAGADEAEVRDLVRDAVRMGRGQR